VTKSHLEVDPEKQVYPERSRTKSQVEGAHLSAGTSFCEQEIIKAEARRLAKIQEPEGQKVTMANPGLAEFEGLESPQIIALIPRERAMQLYTRTKGVYGRDEAIAEVLKYRQEAQANA